jgi:hypothetical protein
MEEVGERLRSAMSDIAPKIDLRIQPIENAAISSKPTAKMGVRFWQNEPNPLAADPARGTALSVAKTGRDRSRSPDLTASFARRLHGP